MTNPSDEEPMCAVDEMENLAMVLLTHLSRIGEFGRLVRISEHIHRLRMRKEATNHLSDREQLVWDMAWALDALARDYTGECKSCISDFMKHLKELDDGSVSPWQAKEFLSRGNEMSDCLVQAREGERYRAATLMGSTLREMTDPRTLL